MRRAAKVDLNHAEILEAVRIAGWKAISTAAIGNSFPDALVAKGGFMALLEVKSEDGKLTKGQEEFCATWPGVVILARTVNQTVMELEDAYRRAARLTSA